MLKNNLYILNSLVETETNKFEAEISLNAEHGIFKGHFPTQAILPGVCIIKILKELISEQLGKVLNIKTASNIKFLNMVDPAVDPYLKFIVLLSDTPEGISVNATATLKNESANFKFKGVFSNG